MNASLAEAEETGRYLVAAMLTVFAALDLLSFLVGITAFSWAHERALIVAWLVRGIGFSVAALGVFRGRWVVGALCASLLLGTVLRTGWPAWHDPLDEQRLRRGFAAVALTLTLGAYALRSLRVAWARRSGNEASPPGP